MAHYVTYSANDQEWRLSDALASPPRKSLGGKSRHARNRSCEDDGLNPSFFARSSNRPPRPSARVAAGRLSPVIPTPLRQHQGTASFDPNWTASNFLYPNAACEDRLVSPISDYDYDEDSHSISDIEFEMNGKLEANDEQNNGVQGLVRPEHSARYSGMRSAMSGRLSRISQLRRISWDYVNRSWEKRRSQRESYNISDEPAPFDWPLPAPRVNFPPEKSAFPTDQEWLSEKIPSPTSPSFPPLKEHDPNLIAWDGPSDPGNPMNWSRTRKWACTLALGFTTFCVTFASSVFSPGTEVAARHFGVSIEVMILATALFVLGFAFGPIIWGPFSELYGRRTPMFVGVAIFAIFQVPCAVAPNLTTLLTCRFLAGFFGAAPITIVGGALADFWAPIDRGVAVSIFSGATFLGPTLGPLVGGYLVQTPGYGWRWTAWVTLFATVLIGTISWLVYPESFAPVLLQRRAKKQRFVTKNWALHAPADEIEINAKAILAKYLAKPFMMLALEPILLLMTIYISFIYGILYLFFETYPLVFHVQRGWSLRETGLPFLAVMVGVIIGGCVNFAFIKTRYTRIMKADGYVPPEERLVPMMVGAVALPAGLFLYAWTSDFDSPWPQIAAGAPCGMGIVLIFLQGLNYIIDCYLMFSNSAIAGNTFIRSIFGASFPMFAIYMYRDLGVKWATATLGFIAVGLMPVPFLFFTFGKRIRKMSRFVPQLPPGMTGGAPGGPPGGPIGMPPKMESTAPPNMPTQQRQKVHPIISPVPTAYKDKWQMEAFVHPPTQTPYPAELSAMRPPTGRYRDRSPDSNGTGSSNYTFKCAGDIAANTMATPYNHYNSELVFPTIPPRGDSLLPMLSSSSSFAIREFAPPSRTATPTASNFSYKNPSPVISRPGTAIEMPPPAVGRI